MKSKPMLFSAPMVRALLEGKKTQTRRLVKPQPSEGWSPTVGTYHPTEVDVAGQEYPGEAVFGASDENEGRVCQLEPGCEVWVRETWATDRSIDSMRPSQFTGWPVRYLADGTVLRHGALYGQPDGKTRVSIHMPRWASRITLKVTDVRVQRLQDISEEDAIAEGILEDGAGWCGYKTATVTGPWQRHAEDAYRNLWESINGPGSWDANPWVWAYTFEVKK